VDISLQHPEFGARRLVRLLEPQGIAITSSAAYRILKRHGIQTRDKRLAKIQAQQAAGIIPPEDAEIVPAEAFEAFALEETEAYPADEDQAYPPGEFEAYPAEEIEDFPPGVSEESSSGLQQIPATTGEAHPPALRKMLSGEVEEKAIPQPSAHVEPYSDIGQVKKPPSQVLSVSRAVERTRAQRPWVLTFVNIFLLLALLFLGFSTWRNFHYARVESPEVATAARQPARAAASPQIETPPLSAYGVIAERNLFNISTEQTPPPEKEIAVENIALAEKDLGLKLVGTVVADDPQLRRAFIDNRKTREQEAYREGDEAGTVKIKRILRDKVVITTDRGDELLVIEPEASGEGRVSPPSLQRTIGSMATGLEASGRQIPNTRTRSIKVNREEVAAYLADTDKLLDELPLSPYMQGDESAGFRLGRIPAQSVLRKMGLRSRDVIVGVDGQEISSPDQAVDFFQKLAQGGEVTVTFKRRRRTRQINLNIE
jgi:general secretion pathway protein C